MASARCDGLPVAQRYTEGRRGFPAGGDGLLVASRVSLIGEEGATCSAAACWEASAVTAGRKRAFGARTP